MSKTNLTFEKCGISIHNGTLTIETSNYYNFEKHYNVNVEIDEDTNTIKVTGEKCIIECNLFGSESGRENVSYQSNHYIIKRDGEFI